MTVTTRRERRQQQRRQEQRRSSGGGGGGSRRISQIWIVLGVVVVIVALILVGRAAGVFAAPTAPPTDVNAVDVSGPKIGTHFDNTGNAHIPTGQAAHYAQIPPTSAQRSRTRCAQRWTCPRSSRSWDTVQCQLVEDRDVETGAEANL